MRLEDLVKTIDVRSEADPSESWTAKLLSQGPEKCAEKFGEEAVEAIIEAVKGDNRALISEAADVIFHYLIMLAILRLFLPAQYHQPQRELVRL